MSNYFAEHNLWPYDELILSSGPLTGDFLVSTPWLTLKLKISAEEIPKLQSLASKFQTQSLSLADHADLNWLLNPLLHYPLAYLLPRAQLSTLGLNSHAIVDASLQKLPPFEFLSASISKEADPDLFVATLSLAYDHARDWNWDLDSALAFSRSGSGHDPLSILSVARRYSLVESNAKSDTKALFDVVQNLKQHPERLKLACAFIVRQNHFVTLKCDTSLQPALKSSQGAQAAVQSFISAEQGHDKLLERALLSLVDRVEIVQVVEASKILMHLLKQSASRNFLGFALAIDIFERSSYLERDPLAELLHNSGFSNAAKQVDIHKGINDSGSHENVSIELLSHMGVVDEAYATEAIRFAELISFVVQRVSADISSEINKI